MDPAGAAAKLAAGADLVQIYSGLIYRGPGFVRELLRGMSS
jgi:dihydroorotate dehydrogenase